MQHELKKVLFRQLSGAMDTNDCNESQFITAKGDFDESDSSGEEDSPQMQMLLNVDSANDAALKLQYEQRLYIQGAKERRELVEMNGFNNQSNFNFDMNNLFDPAFFN